MIDHARKARLYALVIELHQRGIRSTTQISAILGISDEYARRIRIDVGLHQPGPRSIEQAMQLIDDDLRARVAALRDLLENPTKTSATA